MKPKFCPNCGAVIGPNISYCPECDHHFGRSSFTIPLLLIFVCVLIGVVLVAVYSRTSDTSSTSSTSVASSSSGRYDSSPFTALAWCQFLAHRQFYIAEVDSEGPPWHVSCRGLKVEYRSRDDCVHQCMGLDYDRYKMKGILPEWAE